MMMGGQPELILIILVLVIELFVLMWQVIVCGQPLQNLMLRITG